MSRAATAHPSPWSRRGDVALRILAAIPIGYAVASLWAMAIARFLPTSPSEATTTGALASFAICAVAAMYAFAARSGARALTVLLLLGAVAGAATWLSMTHGARL
jgi:hypothetical protein